MSAPLTGIRVLDFGAMIAGPYCARLLADLGAEVIKIEPPEGEFIRSRPPLRDGHSLYFGVLNAGKRSVCVDLKKPASIALIKELVVKADVIVENFRPGVMARLGLGFDALTALNPRLIYCAISGYGQTGSHAQSAAYAPIVQAASGYELAFLGYQTNAERPPNAAIFTADYLTGTHAFGAICAALVQRGRTGAGTLIDCALMDAMLGMLAFEVAEAQEPLTAPRPVYRASKAQDGFVMIMPLTSANFEAMARACGHAEWIADSRFVTSRARAEPANWNALMDAVDRWVAARSVAQCVETLSAAGVPCTRYQTIGEVIDSRYATERGSFALTSSGDVRYQVPNPPFKMAGAGTSGPVPGLGEHTVATLTEVLNMSPAQIESLYADGALCRPR